MIADLTTDLDTLPEDAEPDDFSIEYRKCSATERKHPEKFLKAERKKAKAPRQQVNGQTRNVRQRL